MTGPSAFELLLPLSTRGVDLGLDAVRAALARYGDPQQKIPAVHVTGTNGKGSACAMVHAILRASGARAGLYTSPHLHRFDERVRVCDDPIDGGLATELAREILADMAAGRVPALTFFEATTVLAWRAFEAAGLAWAVVEVGLGGRLDATNVCAPRATAITRVALDHERLLGTTVAEIAYEKAGILKPGVPCVLGASLGSGPARDVIDAVARSVGAPLRSAPAVHVHASGVSFRWQGSELRCALGLAGDHQADNAAVAVGLCDALVSQGAAITGEAVARGLAGVRWPARLERIGRVTLDGAHNPDGVAALCAALASQGEHVEALVFGASSDKPWEAMLTTLIDATGVAPARRFFGAVALERAVPVGALARWGEGVGCQTPAEALERALAAVAAPGRLLVCGSLYFVARVRAALLGIDEDPPVAL